jgi:hypothetical protein
MLEERLHLRIAVRQLGLVTMLALAGCEYQQAGTPNAPGTPSASGPTPESAETPSPPPVQTEQPPERTAPVPSVPPAASAAAVQVRLSAGVALPQTGPTGTMMGFSVDYEFANGRPDGAAKYAWIIQRVKGPEAAVSVKLKAKGTLQKFLLDWRPSDGPFTSTLVELRPNGSKHPIATSVTLR